MTHYWSHKLYIYGDHRATPIHKLVPRTKHTSVRKIGRVPSWGVTVHTGIDSYFGDGEVTITIVKVTIFGPMKFANYPHKADRKVIFGMNFS